MSPTIADLIRLHSNPTAGADALKQLYQWRQELWISLTLGVISPTLALAGSVAISVLKEEFKASHEQIVGSILAIVAVIVSCFLILILARRRIGNEYLLAMEIFNNL
jgi:hypothetical protein